MPTPFKVNYTPPAEEIKGNLVYLSKYNSQYSAKRPLIQVRDIAPTPQTRNEVSGEYIGGARYSEAGTFGGAATLSIGSDALLGIAGSRIYEEALEDKSTVYLHYYMDAVVEAELVLSSGATFAVAAVDSAYNSGNAVPDDGVPQGIATFSAGASVFENKVGPGWTIGYSADSRSPSVTNRWLVDKLADAGSGFATADIDKAILIRMPDATTVTVPAVTALTTGNLFLYKPARHVVTPVQPRSTLLPGQTVGNRMAYAFDFVVAGDFETTYTYAVP